MSARPIIGRCVYTRHYTPRTIQQAFGPYARLDVPSRNRWDSLIGGASAVLLVTLLALLGAGVI